MPKRPATFRPTPLPSAAPQRCSARKRGYTSTWDKASKSFLQANPLCFYHLTVFNEVVAATHTDHYYPPSGPHDPLFWEPSNWRAACESCNSAKQDMPPELFLQRLRSRLA